MIGLVFFFFSTAFTLSSPPFFQSNFESGAVFLKLPFAGEGILETYESPALNAWPKSGGEGLILWREGARPRSFRYRGREGGRFEGAVAESHDTFPAFSQIRFGSLNEWLEKSPVIEVVRDPALQGYFTAKLQAPENAYAALTAPLDSLKAAWVSFRVMFSREYLGLADALRFENTPHFHQLLSDESYWEFVQVGIHGRPHSPRLFLIARFGNRRDTLYSSRPVRAEVPYQVSYCYIEKEGEVTVRFLIDRMPVDSLAAGGVRDNPFMTRFRFHTADSAPYCVDDIQVSGRFEGFPPSRAPEVLFHDPVLSFSHPEEASPAIQWEACRDGALFPVFQSWPGPALVAPGRVLPGPGAYLVRARALNPSFLPGPWSPELRLTLDSSQFLRDTAVVQEAWVARPGGKRPVTRLVPGAWHDLCVKVHPGAWNMPLPYFALHAISPDEKNEWVFGSLYHPRRSLLLSFRLVTRAIWVADKPGIYTYGEYSGRAGDLVDATDKGFVLDPEGNFFKLRFRLPLDAEPGPWVLRESTRPHHWKQYYALLTVGPEEPPVAGKARLWIWVLFATAALGLAALAVRARAKSPAPAFVSRYQKSVDEVKKALESSYGSKVDFDALAGSLGFTEPNLRKIFRKAAGETPLHYLIAFRLDKAREYLSSTADSVNDIAYRVGFSEPSYFMKAFKKKFRMTPSEWRERGMRGG